ncbi:MAG TPA: hypothetical protein DCP31_31790 [Cyanobacteria bacterium UBA8543]|nr:hypothetical protein [Cyanobacteria bacterium UBA8543]
MIEVERYYRILDLQPGASPEEIHQGYLDLTWVWHPDRFTGHPRLQQKAVYKLQELNEAHEQLRSFRPVPQTRDLRPKSNTQASSSVYQQSSARDLHKPEVHQPTGEYHQKPRQKYKRPVSVNVRDVDDWLD